MNDQTFYYNLRSLHCVQLAENINRQNSNTYNPRTDSGLEELTVNNEMLKFNRKFTARETGAKSSLVGIYSRMILDGHRDCTVISLKLKKSTILV